MTQWFSWRTIVPIAAATGLTVSAGYLLIEGDPSLWLVGLLGFGASVVALLGFSFTKTQDSVEPIDVQADPAAEQMFQALHHLPIGAAVVAPSGSMVANDALFQLIGLPARPASNHSRLVQADLSGQGG